MFPNHFYISSYKQDSIPNTPFTPLDFNYSQSMLPRNLLVGSPFIASPVQSNYYAQNPHRFLVTPGSNGHKSSYVNGFIGPPPPKLNLPPKKSKKESDLKDYQETSIDSSSEYNSTDNDNTVNNENFNAGPMNVHYDNQNHINLNLSRNMILKSLNGSLKLNEILDNFTYGPIEYCKLVQTEDENGDPAQILYVSFINSIISYNFYNEINSNFATYKKKFNSPNLKINFNKIASSSNFRVNVLNGINNGATRCLIITLANHIKFPSEEVEAEQKKIIELFNKSDSIEDYKIEGKIIIIHFTSINTSMKNYENFSYFFISNSVSKYKWQIMFFKDRCDQTKIEQPQSFQQVFPIRSNPNIPIPILNFNSENFSNYNNNDMSNGNINGIRKNLGNRTLYLGNLHPETTVEEICNNVRGGLLESIKLIQSKKICFITFIEFQSSYTFYINSQINNLFIHQRKIKVGWGNRSSELSNNIKLAVTTGASRNIYIGLKADLFSAGKRLFSEQTLRNDFREFGEIEQINFLSDEYCGFINYTNIASAMRVFEYFNNDSNLDELFLKYKDFKISFGKDRCGNQAKLKKPMKKKSFHKVENVEIDRKEITDHEKLVLASMGITSRDDNIEEKDMKLKPGIDEANIDEDSGSDTSDSDDDGISILINSDDIPSPKSVTSISRSIKTPIQIKSNSSNYSVMSRSSQPNYSRNSSRTNSSNSINYFNIKSQQYNLNSKNFGTSGSQVMAQYLAQSQHENLLYATSILNSNDDYNDDRGGKNL